MKETVLSCRHLTFFYDGDTPYENGAATSSAHSPAPGAATHENGSATAAQSSTAAPASHENGSAPTTQSSSSERPVFKDISLTLHRGEAILLMGPSGCGKSTLAYCLAGLYPEYGGRLEGEILVENEPIKALGPAKRATLVSILFQNPDNQFCMDRVDKEVLFALENINYQGDLRARMRELLKMVGLEASEMQLIRKLSGGMKQKLALCTALATGARTFILDEPFANLDPASCRYLAALLKKMKEEQGISLLVVDHKVDHWRDFMDRVVLMDAPEICGTNPHDAPAAAATTDIDHAAAATTTNTNRLYVDAAADTTNRAACTASTDRTTLHHDDEPCRVPAPGDLDARSIDPAQLEAHAEEFSRRGLFLGNGYVAGHEPRPISEKNDLAVVADDMEVLFDKKHSFMKHVNLRLEKGSVTALVGSCGSGKTSLLMALAEAYPHKGRLEVAGRVGLVFQNPRFQFLALTVEDELRQSLSLAHPDMPAEEMEALIDRQLEEFALPGMRKQSPYAISQGQQRRLALLSMLLCDCPIMLLDEPTYAQDERSTRFIMELLDKRIAEGLTVVMATHDPELAKAYANHIFVMQDGEMKEVSAAALDTLAIYASEETAPSDFRTATATDESGKNDTASTAESDRRETTAATAADDSERNDNDAAVVSENNKVIAGRDKTNRD
ncbi:MAG: ATP-binding cassette domain-containing protein, partial [Lachnospiraceae bacterium]|nr:ATP-binding cassette domain-containing protein [Lachnospiraceae bacterium]